MLFEIKARNEFILSVTDYLGDISENMSKIIIIKDESLGDSNSIIHLWIYFLTLAGL